MCIPLLSARIERDAGGAAAREKPDQWISLSNDERVLGGE
jgi:hypothetical protein